MTEEQQWESKMNDSKTHTQKKKTDKQIEKIKQREKFHQNSHSFTNSAEFFIRLRSQGGVD